MIKLLICLIDKTKGCKCHTALCTYYFWNTGKGSGELSSRKEAAKVFFLASIFGYYRTHGTHGRCFFSPLFHTLSRCGRLSTRNAPNTSSPCMNSLSPRHSTWVPHVHMQEFRPPASKPSFLSHLHNRVTFAPLAPYTSLRPSGTQRFVNRQSGFLLGDRGENWLQMREEKKIH